MNRRSIAIAAILTLVIDGVAWGTSHDPRSKIAVQIDSYARHLADSGQSERASEIEEYARTFRAAGRSTEESVFLGFNPVEVLTEYVNVLRELGQEKRADAVRRLTEWYNCSNEYGFLIQRSEYEGPSREEAQTELAANLREECRDILGLRTDASAQTASNFEPPRDVQEEPQERGPIFRRPGSGSGSMFRPALQQ